MAFGCESVMPDPVQMLTAIDSLKPFQHILFMENNLDPNGYSETQTAQQGVSAILRIAHALENGGDPFILLSQLRSLEAPVDNNPCVLEQLKKINQTTLIKLLAGKGEWIPLFLDSLEDRKLAQVLKVVFGAFCTDVLPPSIIGYNVNIPYPSLHPGRSVCGATNLEPLFKMLATTPVSTIKKALPIIRRSDSCVEDAPYYLTHLLGIDYRRPKQQGQTTEIFFELTRRIAAESPEREALLAARATSLALDYFNRVARSTVASTPAFRHLRALVCAHAESSGFPSVNAALLDLSRRWIATKTYEVEGCTLHKVPNTPEGIRLSKAGKTIKNLPPSMRKDPLVTKFRAEAFALWQTWLSFDDEALSHYLEQGELFENQEFFSVFGFQPSSTIRKRLETIVPENLESEIRSLLEQNNCNEYPLVNIPPISPAKTFPEMIRRGWEHWFQYKGIYGGIYSQYKDPSNTSNIVIGLRPLNRREQPKEGLTPPVTMQSLVVCRETKTDLSSSCRNERVLGLILSDLVEVFLEGKKTL